MKFILLPLSIFAGTLSLIKFLRLHSFTYENGRYFDSLNGIVYQEQSQIFYAVLVIFFLITTIYLFRKIFSRK